MSYTTEKEFNVFILMNVTSQLMEVDQLAHETKLPYFSLKGQGLHYLYLTIIKNNKRDSEVVV